MIILPYRTVIVECPFKATESRTQEQHELYLRHALTDCVSRHESPYASHHYLTSVLDDDDPLERAMGLKLGWAIGDLLDACVVFCDMGISPGMMESIKHYEDRGKPIERRTLNPKVVRSILDM